MVKDWVASNDLVDGHFELTFDLVAGPALSPEKQTTVRLSGPVLQLSDMTDL